MADQESEPVRIQTDGPVLAITLDRPAAKNSLGPTAVRAMIEAIEAVAADDSVRVVSIASSGPDFCAGADVVALNKKPGADAPPKPKVGNIERRVAVQAHRLIEVIMSVQVPVVCTVRGWAAGLGFQLALAADFTIAADDARFWEPFCGRGFTPDSGATWLLPRLVGVARAKDLLMLSREISGAEASQWGVIHRSVPDAELDGTSAAFVADLAGRATIALGLTKHCINESLHTSLTDALAREAFVLELSSRTSDFREGMASFADKRPPDYQGR
jgi:2-(1,2-epoxy-1,2-dihydrophenyl)acetyl-CoA isomerase